MNLYTVFRNRRQQIETTFIIYRGRNVHNMAHTVESLESTLECIPLTYLEYEHEQELKFKKYEDEQSMEWAKNCLSEHKLEEDYIYEKRGVNNYDEKYVSRKYNESITRRMDRLHEELLEDYLDFRRKSDPSFHFSEISSAQESLWPEFRATVLTEPTPAELRKAWEAFLERRS